MCGACVYLACFGVWVCLSECVGVRLSIHVCVWLCVSSKCVCACVFMNLRNVKYPSSIYSNSVNYLVFYI